MRKRDWNERHFDRWENLGGGGRRYVTRVFGRSFGGLNRSHNANYRAEGSGKKLRFSDSSANG